MASTAFRGGGGGGGGGVDGGCLRRVALNCLLLLLSDVFALRRYRDELGEEDCGEEDSC